MKFVCSFAWADFVLAPKEHALVERFVRALPFDGEELLQIEQWLARPPDPHEFELGDVPRAHRIVFVQAVEAMILSDGKITKQEKALFNRLVAWSPPPRT
jgi:hypothetical protein